jgi:TatD DNase family protein
MYFDSHAHLDEACFQPDFDDILARMAAAGVTGLMDIGCDRASSLRAVALAEKYPWIWAAIGSHPDSADEATDEGLAFYRELAQNPRVRAVGEIGLDYHYETIPRERQKDAFRRQMALAQELRLPVVVHEREAHGDGLAVVDEFPACAACSTAIRAVSRWRRSS